MYAQSDKADWWEHAACADKPVELFVYPDRPTGAVERRATEAVSICYTCSVRQECAQAEADAIHNGALPYKYQVRGGMRLWKEELPPPSPDPIPTRHGADRCATCKRNAEAWCHHPPRQPGNQTGPLPEYRTHALPVTGININPHVRRPL